MASSVTSDILDTGSVTIASSGTWVDTGLSVTVTLTDGEFLDLSAVVVALQTPSNRIALLVRLTDGTNAYTELYWNDANTVTQRRSFRLSYKGIVGTDIDAGEYTFKVQARNVATTSCDIAGTGDFFSKMYAKVISDE